MHFCHKISICSRMSQKTSLKFCHLGSNFQNPVNISKTQIKIDKTQMKFCQNSVQFAQNSDFTTWAPLIQGIVLYIAHHIIIPIPNVASRIQRLAIKKYLNKPVFVAASDLCYFLPILTFQLKRNGWNPLSDGFVWEK